VNSIQQIARDNLTVTISTIDRGGNVLERRAFSGAGDPDHGIERCGSLANAEVAATQYENEQRWKSACDSHGWIIDRSYS
jgi:hypothetical protein